ncbi:ABC transporter G family member 20-like [Bacillus rossius redtenbacheri]|uniref:ABC transporter G family member 20-like n=1 Tax=Bacillus rossius redtenbacheri TaxID=93214 RepID=UPI002FDDEDB2
MMELQPLPLRDRSQLAVSVRRGCKQYGDVPVLSQLNMSVRTGHIYGLLGASGCGKTTLLSCVVGRRHLDKGEIRVLGGAPCSKGRWLPHRRLGYMPQETALYQNISTRETLRYFGWIYGLSSAACDERLEFLARLLDLPARDQKVKTLSGGQTRRVSLAAALLHDPEVLVLDEPTVGMDPVLRDVIWRHLLQITSSGRRTIILTTHYIEEASLAHTIGLLRNGHLLDEDCPKELLRKHGLMSLEDVFFKLSLMQEKTDSMASITDYQENQEIGEDGNSLSNETDDVNFSEGTSNKIVPATPTKDCCGILSKGSMKALLFKNIITTTRDPSYMAFIFGLCVVAVSGLYAGFGFAPRQLRIAVSNRDLGSPDPRCGGSTASSNCSLEDLSCRYLRHLEGPSVVKVSSTASSNCSLEDLSCRYLRHLEGPSVVKVSSTASSNCSLEDLSCRYLRHLEGPSVVKVSSTASSNCSLEDLSCRYLRHLEGPSVVKVSSTASSNCSLEDLSCRYLRHLEGPSVVKVSSTASSNCSLEDLSCRYLRHLEGPSVVKVSSTASSNCSLEDLSCRYLRHLEGPSVVKVSSTASSNCSLEDLSCRYLRHLEGPSVVKVSSTASSNCSLEDLSCRYLRHLEGPSVVKVSSTASSNCSLEDLSCRYLRHLEGPSVVKVSSTASSNCSLEDLSCRYLRHLEGPSVVKVSSTASSNCSLEDLSCRYLRHLEGPSVVKVSSTASSNCSLEDLSCRYLRHLEGPSVVKVSSTASSNCSLEDLSCRYLRHLEGPSVVKVSSTASSNCSLEDLSCRYLRHLEGPSVVKVSSTASSNCSLEDLSCRYLRHLEGPSVVKVSSTASSNCSLEDLSCRYLRHLEGPSVVKVSSTASSNCSLEDLSCRYLRHLEGPSVVKEFFDSAEAALEAVRRGRAWGALLFHENFTRGLLERATEQTLASDDSLEQGSVQVRLDMSNQVVAWLLRDQLYSKYVEFAEDILASCDKETKIANIPVRFNEPVYGERRPEFIDYTAPAVLSAMMFFFGVALSVWGIAYERKQGLLDRNIVAGVKSFEIFFGYFLSQSVLMCGQASLLIVLGIFVYHFQCHGDLALVVVLLLLQGVCGMALGFVISAACEDEVTATVVASGSIQPMLYLCGIIWPLEGMNSTLRYVALVLPLSLPIRAMRSIMSRAWGVSSHEVVLGFAASFLWIGAFFVLCTVIIRFKKL